MNQPAADVLHHAYRASGDEAKLFAFLESRVNVVSDRLAKKDLLIEQATLREKQARPELAYIALYRAFKEDPNDRDVRARLEVERRAVRELRRARLGVRGGAPADRRARRRRRHLLQARLAQRPEAR